MANTSATTTATPAAAAAPASTVLTSSAPSAPPAPVAPVAADPKTAAAPAEPVKPAEAAPAEYAFKAPEGVTFDEKTVEAFKATAKELGLDASKAQKVADVHVQAQAALREQAKAQYEEQKASWTKALATDKEFGGAAFEASKILAAKAVEKFATPELKEMFEESGLGNHPEFVRLFVRLGKAMAEDSVAGTRSGAASQQDEQSFLNSLYPKQAALQTSKG